MILPNMNAALLTLKSGPCVPTSYHATMFMKLGDKISTTANLLLCNSKQGHGK